MTLNALAPDQRAVVQLVLQQERSYDDLAGLLGISTDAVRARALAGLDRLAPAGDLGDEERGRLADYVLGQQGVSERERTRELIASSPDARNWAREVVEQLTSVTGTPPVDIPDDDDAPAPITTTTTAADFDDDDDDDLPDFGRPLPGEEDDDEDLPDFGERAGRSAAVAAESSEPASTPVAGDPAPEDLGRPVAPRPRPRRAARDADRALAGARPGADKPSSSKLGGILLIAGLGLVLAAALILLFRGGDDDPERETTATPTATAQAAPEPVATVPLTSPTKGKAKGTLNFYVAQQGQEAAVAFVIEASDVPESKEGETYGVWLTGGGRTPRRLGFTEPVGKDGRLGASGPEEGKDAKETAEKQAEFVRDLGRYRTLVISRETTEDAKKPGGVVLQGKLPQGG